MAVDPRLLAEVELVPLFDGVDGLLNLLRDGDDVARLRNAWVRSRNERSGRRPRDVGDVPDVVQGSVSPPSSGGGDKEEFPFGFLRGFRA